MPVDYTQRIIDLAQAKHVCERPTSKDWERTEQQLRITFPKDYKDISNALGRGAFGCGLHLRNPAASSQFLALSHEALVAYRETVLSGLREAPSFSIYPDPNGAVFVGHIDRQSILIRPNGNSRQRSVTAWWDLDAEEIKELDLSLTQLLHDLYLGLIDEEWAREMREYVWRGGRLPFFTPHRLEAE